MIKLIQNYMFWLPWPMHRSISAAWIEIPDRNLKQNVIDHNYYSNIISGYIMSKMAVMTYGYHPRARVLLTAVLRTYLRLEIFRGICAEVTLQQLWQDVGDGDGLGVFWCVASNLSEGPGWGCLNVVFWLLRQGNGQLHHSLLWSNSIDDWFV